MIHNWLETGLIEENKLYTVDVKMGLLLEYNLDNFSYRILKKIELNILEKWCRVNNIVKVEEVLYLSFSNHDFILAYDLKTGNLQKYGEDIGAEQRWRVDKMLLFGEELWILPAYIDQKIRVFNLASKSFREEGDIATYLQSERKSIGKEESLQFIGNTGTKFHWVIVKSPYLITLDTSEKKVYIYETNRDYKLFKGIFDGRYYWISLIDKAVVIKWDFEKGIVEEKEIKEIQIDDRRLPIEFAFERNDYLYVIPMYIETIFVFDQNNLKKEQKFLFKRLNSGKYKGSFSTILFYQQYALLLPHNANKMIRINLNDGKIIAIDNMLKKEDWRKHVLNAEYLQSGECENEYFKLEEFIQYQCQEM